MATLQPDLFSTAAPAFDKPSEAVIAGVRARLLKTLAEVRGAPKMPWDDLLTIIHKDNEFRWGKELLPRAEAAALWAEFDAEMDRLYAIMNQGRDLNY